MDGGRGGGGRGKGKKGKAAKKKTAAASQAAGSQKKVATHGAKKVGANHSNVQVVVVSGAPEPANSAASHDPTMSKSKRKRLKKLAGAANAKLKKQAAAEAVKASQTHVQQAKKSPTAAGSTTSPKTKMVVLTPPTVKPHVVSLTGKKKKRKRNTAVVTESGETTSKDGQFSEGNKSPKMVGTPPATAKTKTVVATVSSPKRKLAQMQHAQKSGNVMTRDISVKTGVVPSPRESLKVKAKPVIVAVTTAESESSIVLAEEKSQIQGKSDVQQSQEFMTAASAQVTKPETTTQMSTIVQTNNTTNKELVDQSEQAMKLIADDKHDAAVTTLSKADTVTIPSNTVITTKVATGNAMDHEGKLLSATALSDASTIPFTSSKPLEVTPDASTVASGSNMTDEIISQGSVQSVATSATSTHLPAAITTASPNLAEGKLATSPLVEAKISNPSLLLPRGGIKRRRPTDQTSTSSSVDSSQPPVKRNVAANERSVTQPSSNDGQMSADKQCSAPELSTSSRIQLQHTVSTVKRPPGDAPVEETCASAKEEKVKSPLSASKPAARRKIDKKELGNQTQSAGKKSMKLIPERKTTTAQGQSTSSKATQSKLKKLQPTIKIKASTSVTAFKPVEKDDRYSSPYESGSATTTKSVDFLDSHTYVQKMIMSDLKCGSKDNFRDTQPAMVLPPRSQNAWGASFGMVPPVQRVSSALKTMATTPLSSWFLSKGCANFVKQVHFSDDDDSSYSDDDSGVNQSLLTPRCFDKASPKRRASTAKKNAFLESLTTQSNWRTWYGHVDLHNLLDPPLDRVPEKLRTHEVTPLALPEPAVGNGNIMPTKNTNELEILEADIRREKLRGSAFSDQLLTMLQGKTVSGKLLEEEYGQLLH